MEVTQNSQNNPEKENQIQGLILPDFKTYYKNIVIKKVCCWSKDRNIDQFNGIKSPQINHHIYNQLAFDAGAKTSVNCSVAIENPHAKEYSWISTSCHIEN